eukprot:752405-Hanusia_phi.AAC.5
MEEERMAAERKEMQYLQYPDLSLSPLPTASPALSLLLSSFLSIPLVLIPGVMQALEKSEREAEEAAKSLQVPDSSPQTSSLPPVSSPATSSSFLV